MISGKPPYVSDTNGTWDRAAPASQLLLHRSPPIHQNRANQNMLQASQTQDDAPGKRTSQSARTRRMGRFPARRSAVQSSLEMRDTRSKSQAQANSKKGKEDIC